MSVYQLSAYGIMVTYYDIKVKRNGKKSAKFIKPIPKSNWYFKIKRITRPKPC